MEDALLGCTIQDIPRLVPGLLLTIAVVLVAIQLTDWVNQAVGYKGLISHILTAIILGMLVRNILGLAPVFLSGVSFSLRKLLRLGIILMGIRLSFSDVVTIGVWGIPIVIVCILAGLVVTTYFTRLLKLPDRLGTLIAVGTSICGASAIVATAPGIGAKDEEVTYAVANITVFGIIAMFTYPYLANVLFSSDITQVGLFTGTAIHETAQVTGAGLIYDQSFDVVSNPSAADVAVVTKLVRNVMMALVIPGMAFLYARRMASLETSPGQSSVGILQLVPLFIAGFLLLAVLRSIGDASLESGDLAMGMWSGGAWAGITDGVKSWSGYILATAMAGVGLGTSFRSMKGLGMKSFMVGLFAAAMVGLTSVALVFLIGPFVEL